jgi:hypothetical protein
MATPKAVVKIILISSRAFPARFGLEFLAHQSMRAQESCQIGKGFPAVTRYFGRLRDDFTQVAFCILFQRNGHATLNGNSALLVCLGALQPEDTIYVY